MKQALCDCESCIMGDIGKCQYDNDSSNISIKADSDFEDEDDGDGEQIDLDDDVEDDGDDVEDDGDDVEDFSMISELVEPGKVIALRTPPEEKQSFYLLLVNEVTTAVTDIYNAYHHFVLKGDRYISGSYLDIVKERKKDFIQYRKCTATVFVLHERYCQPLLT